MKKQHLKLKQQDHRYLTKLLSKGHLPTRVARRVSALLLLDEGSTFQTVAEQLGIVCQTASAWRDKYLENGLEFLTDKAKPGRPIEIDGHVRAKITALACSQEPAGYASWSLRLLADKAVELEICESISHTQVGVILKKTTETPPEKDLVYWRYELIIYCPHGANLIFI
jgi:transposase